jgi:catalase
MHGYGSHTFKWVNKEGKANWVKFHFKSDQGIKNLTHERATEIAGIDPDYSTRDLQGAIEAGDYPSWTFCVQVMPLEDVEKQKFDPFDLTKVWSKKDYPLREVGKMVLDRVPNNYFAEVEQAAFSPAHMPPGIEASPDRVLQARLWSYDDAARYRIGTNYLHLPINACPFAKVQNYQRDGAMMYGENGGDKPNYYPNSYEELPQPDPQVEKPASYMQEGGVVGKYEPQIWKDQDDYEQPRQLWQLMNEEDKENTIKNIAGHMGQAKPFIQERMIGVWRKVDEELATRLEKMIPVSKEKVEKGEDVKTMTA